MKSPDPTRKPRAMPLGDRTWAQLEAIARARGLLWGGLPNRTEAVRLLAEEEAERLGIRDGPAPA